MNRSIFKKLVFAAALVAVVPAGSNALHAQSLVKPAEPFASGQAQSVPRMTPPPVLDPFLQSSQVLENGGAGRREVLTVQATDGDYVISPSDTIQVAVFQEPDLSVETTVSRDGSAQLPLINDVKIGGLTVRQARDSIRALYNADYLVEPQVSLGVIKFAERKFTIIGQVNSPGTYAITGSESINLIEAIGMAGGFTRIADRGRVVVKRDEGGQVKAMKVNAKKMAGSSISPIEVKAGDIISVGESWY